MASKARVRLLLGYSLTALLLLGVSCSTAETPIPSIWGGDDQVIPGPGGDAFADGRQPGPDIPDVECEDDEDCGKLHCDISQDKCVECLINPHCPEGYKCDATHCVPKEGQCTSDAQCIVTGLVCDEEKGQCVECANQDDCDTGEYCLDGKCIPWVCTPGAAWCMGTTALACNPEGSVVVSEVECDDGDVCTAGDACLNGECQETQPKNCDDNNPCTEDLCDPKTGCYLQFVDGDCEDGTDCTVGDHCQEGACVSGELVCECALDGDCKDKEDGNLCNGTLFCQGGYCVLDSGTIIECEGPDDPCLATTCDPDTGNCVEEAAPNGEECDDGDDCTSGDNCTEGECVGEDLACEDGNPCTSDDCDAELGCVHDPVEAACNDGNKCTDPDYCLDGVCIGTKIECEDGNPCTANNCLPAKGCVLEEIVGPCEDGDACTVNDTCTNSVCVGVPADCVDDGNFCTNDFCDPQEGCVYEPNDLPCDDGNECTVNDHCQGGECIPGSLLFACDDGNGCTTDSCNVDTGECIYTNNVQACNDGDLCTENDMCAGGICVPGTPVDCDDDNACTGDSCNTQGSCVHAPIAGSCDDGNLCTAGDACLGGACQPGTGVKCNDSNSCTDDVCVPEEGCLFVPNQAACSDNDTCTQSDKCVDGECVGGEMLDCEDNNPCTNDSCNPDMGCENVPNNLGCDDGNACTANDYCAAAVCLSGPSITCDDENSCTDDYCVSETGCLFQPNALLCEDGDACTANDYCSLGDCQSGQTLDCDDGNDCTEDTCNFDSCLHPFVDGACDDGNACTDKDVCKSGLCAGILVANCGCYSLALNGTGYGLVEYGAPLNPAGEFTVELWFKRDPNAVVAQFTTLLSRWRWTGINQRSFRLGINAPNSLSFQVEDPQGGAGAVVTGNVPNNDKWHHVAAVYNGTELALYIDGAVANAVNFTAGMAASTVPLVMGGRYAVGSDSVADFLSGWVDEIRFSGAALYSGASFVPEPWLAVTEDTLAYWGANQGQFSAMFDTGGNALHAALHGGATWSTETPADECVPVPNYPPAAPEISIQPPNPTEDDSLLCQIDVASLDAEVDPIEYQYAWYKNGVLQASLTTDTVPPSATAACPPWQCDQCQKWTCKVTPSDGKPGMPATAVTTVGALGCQTCNGQVWGSNCYFYNAWETNWGSGASSCTQWGGHLVTVADDGENDFVNSLCPGSCWIGLSDSANEGNFVWINGEQVSYTKWASNEPNDFLWNEDCTQLKSNGKWNDANCDGTVAFVCEKEP